MIEQSEKGAPCARLLSFRTETHVPIGNTLEHQRTSIATVGSAAELSELVILSDSERSVQRRERESKDPGNASSAMPIQGISKIMLVN